MSPKRLKSAKPAATSLGYAVNLGYADSLRPNPANFPTPWEGAPNVVYEGCTPSSSCSFDAGAVEVVNTSAAAETVGSVVINYSSSCTYDIWPHTVKLPKGDELIITETKAGGGGGCTPGTGYMDSSDIGPVGQNWAGNCTQSNMIPKITVTVNSVTTSFTDTTQILNTGGVDANSCGHPNESEQWTPVGHAVCYGATLNLAPATKTVVPGTTVAYTATLKNSCGNPLQGAAVVLNVLKGPDAGATSTKTTSSTGVAKFTLKTSATQGIDFVQASTTNPGGSITSPVAHLYNQLATLLTLTPKSGLPGATIKFTGSGFGATESVKLEENASGGPTLTTVTSTATGKISGTFVVPAPTASEGAMSEVVAHGVTSGKEAWALFSSPCTDDWAKAASGNWLTPANWTKGSSPNSSDTACIVLPGTYQVTLLNSLTINALVLGTSATKTPGTQTLHEEAFVNGGVTFGVTTSTTIGKHGVFQLDSLDADNGSIIRGGPITNSGTFATLAGAGSWRYVRASLTNKAGAKVTIGGTTYQDSGTTTINSGAFTIASGGYYQVTNGSSVFDQAAGTFKNSGTFFMNGASYQANGGTESGNAAILQSSTMTDAAGGGSYVLQCTNTLKGTIPSGQTITVQANGCGGAQTNLSGTVTNHGTFNLNSADADNSAIVSGGTLINDGTFNALAGSGGNRYLRSALTNNTGGKVTIGATTYQDSGTKTMNSGAFTIGSGGYFQVTNGNSVFDQAAGTFVNGGTFYMNGSTYQANGGAQSGNPAILQSSTMTDAAGTGSYVLQCTNTLGGTIPVGQTVTVQANGCGGAQTNLSGTVDNHGTFNLNSLNADNSAIVAGGKLINDGTFQALAGSGGTRYLRSALTNNADGTATIGATTNQDSGTRTVTQGAFTIASGGSLNVTNGSSVFDLAAGTFTDNGTFFMNGATYLTSGGTQSGHAAILQSSTLTDATGAGAGSYVLQCTNTVSGTIPAGQTVTVQANGCGSAQTNLSGTVHNHGTFNLNSADADNNTIVSGGKLINDGTFQTLSGSGGSRYLRSNLTNNTDGTVTIGATTYQDSGTTTVNSGAFTIAAGVLFQLTNGSSAFDQAAGTLTNNGTFFLNGSTYQSNGGAESANPVTMQSSTLSDLAGTGSYVLQCSNTLRGSVPAGQKLTVQANGCGGSDLTLTAGGVTNHGTIDLMSLSADSYAMISGGPLTNKGTFGTLAGNGGIEYIRVNIINTGTVSILGHTNRQDSNTSVSNAGTFKLGDGVTYSMSGGSTFSELTGAKYGVTVDAAGGGGSVMTGGSMSVTGTLLVTTVGTPTVSEVFTPVKSTAFSGTFSTISSGTHSYTPTYSSTGFTLTAA